MIKWVIGIIIFLLLLGIVIYVMIPTPVNLASKRGMKSNSAAVYRTLTSQKLWDSLSGEHFVISKRLVNTVHLNGRTDEDSFPLKLVLIPITNDSVDVAWESQLPHKTGMLGKWKRYSSALDIRTSIENALDSFGHFVAKDENIYGSPIKQTSTTDTFLLSTKFLTQSLPTTQEIYQHIGELRSYALSSGAKASGYPMLNITQTDSNAFRCMVALPIDKILSGTGDISFVRMVPGRFLTMEVRGGPANIKQGHTIMQQYFADFNRIAMAIPFESLITDRLTEPDTSKWITKIYGPVY